jgi:twitching motility two-component system response regulator PilH
MSLTKLLKKHGHEVLTARDGAEGVEVAKAELPDLVLMDVVMPKINGFQATRQITKDPNTRHIPVIIVTTKDQETDKIWGERQGAKGYILKPVTEDSIIEAIRQFLPK